MVLEFSSVGFRLNGNDTVDIITERAVRKNIVDIMVQLGREEMKTLTLENGLDCWQRQWDESSRHIIVQNLHGR
jgi:hypothetical protein